MADKPPRTKEQRSQDKTNRETTHSGVAPANWPYCPTCTIYYPPDQGNAHHGH